MTINLHLYDNLKSVLFASLALCCLIGPNLAQAEADYYLLTIDNDALVGEDTGYTNGIYFTWVDTPANNKAKPGFLSRVMMWSMSDSDEPALEYSIKTIGQTMITPEDIEEDPPTPPPDDFPYGGLLFYADSFAKVYDNYADRISTTIGVVGEYSFAEESQEFVHKIIDSDEPCCWDTQLDDEIVFQVYRGRVWRSWVADGDSADLLLGADAELGTIQSSAGASMVVRYGAGLKQTYATVTMVNARISNPIAVDNGWYVYAGLRAGYLANQIFLDGSKSYDDDLEEIEYTNETLGYTVGLAYAWENWSLTVALNDLNTNGDFEGSEDYTKYGTLTLGWRGG